MSVIEIGADPISPIVYNDIAETSCRVFALELL